MIGTLHAPTVINVIKRDSLFSSVLSCCAPLLVYSAAGFGLERKHERLKPIFTFSLRLDFSS